MNVIQHKLAQWPGETSVSVRNLTVSYGSHVALDRLSIDVARGLFLVLLGPSGCGKSTLLNAIAGLIDAHAGEIWISGRDVTYAEPKDRGIGMVFQSYALYPRMTVAQNMGFGLKISGMPKPEVARRVRQAAELLRLEKLLSRLPAELSGGQRQRVAIGRALVRHVDVFLFDEPLSNLDAQLRADLRLEIKRLHLALGNTMIYVTHDQVEAMTLADKIAIMKDGVIQQTGSPTEVYNRPVNRFVASFLGSPSMSFLAGRLTSWEGRLAARLGNCLLPLDGYSFGRSDARGDIEVTVGIRPEHVRLGEFMPAVCRDAGMAPLRGEVTLVEPMGAETIIWTELGGQPLAIRASADATLRVGDQIEFAPDVRRVSLFDATSGERL
ncbi:ABC transporter ATP-binding protein [Mesorhizobium sp. BAC0120]|uniref:ABC transporter ATP-binding protein n=1 Tax=Mesorhizobium sp. BAC0120 TaxID=3090670 RepID=UPI00298D4063|nr:ABC transporter ATP-binding protein [Mesorhizobium sp. BAC0120]MDW6024211.1 ABC transporter ATP-binding protein [Mesorhizobium sp. BAC0120]